LPLSFNRWPEGAGSIRVYFRVQGISKRQQIGKMISLTGFRSIGLAVRTPWREILIDNDARNYFAV
jgi:hypothetical protein